jgi:hypothetical protein
LYVIISIRFFSITICNLLIDLPSYKVTMLNREDWTKGTGAPPAVKGLVWFTDGSKMGGGAQGWSLRAFFGKEAQFFPVFQAKKYSTLACVYEIQSQNRLEKYIPAIVKWLSKHFRPSKQRPRWSHSAKSHWMVSLPCMQWGYTGSLDILKYEVMRSPMSSRGAALFWSSLDLSWPWKSLDNIYRKGSVVS